VAKTGETHELQDRAALTRALAHPWNVWVYFMDRDIAVLAARLYTSLADAHAFAAGNKRTAFRAATAFIEANGCTLDLPLTGPQQSNGCSVISTAGSDSRALSSGFASG